MRQAWADTLQIEVLRCEDYPCIRLTGEGEERGARVLSGIVEHLVRSGYPRMIVDTRELRFLDQHAYDVLLEGLGTLENEDGLMVIVDNCLPVERSLKLLDLEQRAHVASTISQAVAYLDWHE